MTQATHADERAEFEAWLNPEYSRELDGMGGYEDGIVYSMFAAWQAARRAPAVPAVSKLTHDELQEIRHLMQSGGGLLVPLSNTTVPVPHGWKLVPVEPTREMRRAFHSAVNEYLHNEDDSFDDCYVISATIDAAPQHKP